MANSKAMEPVEFRPAYDKAKGLKTDPAFRKLSEGLVKEIQQAVDNADLAKLGCCVEGCCVSWCCVRAVVT